MARPHPNRRDALKAGAAAIALPTIVPSHVLGRDGQQPPSERVRVGIIGTGGRARAIASTCDGTPNIDVVSVCDCFLPRATSFVELVGRDKNWTIYEDFRKMIDKEKLDGVMVETTTHARAWIVIQAMQAGVDTYIEKPMCLTISEGRYMVNAARKYKTVTQVGTQQRSMPINNWASDQVKNGAIGKVHTVLAPNFVGPMRWSSKPAEKMPSGGRGDWWDIWTNQAEMRPYLKELHYGWARWWDYDGGGLCFGVTGWGTHSYDQIQRGLGTDETGPVEIWLEEPVKSMPTGKFEPRDKYADDDTGAAYYRMAKPVIGPRAKVSARFANGTVVKFHLDGDWGPGLGAIFIGDKGKLEINRNKLASNPKSIVLSPDNPGPNKLPETQYHIANWADCIKTRKRCNADIEFGQRASSLCYLVNITRQVGQVGKKLKWDPDAEQFTNCDEANQWLTRRRRKGFELPSLT